MQNGKFWVGWYLKIFMTVIHWFYDFTLSFLCTPLKNEIYIGFVLPQFEESYNHLECALENQRIVNIVCRNSYFTILRFSHNRILPQVTYRMWFSVVCTLITYEVTFSLHGFVMSNNTNKPNFFRQLQFRRVP